MSIIFPLVSKAKESEKMAVKAPMTARRLSMLRMKNKTTVEETGSRDAKTVVIALVKRNTPF